MKPIKPIIAVSPSIGEKNYFVNINYMKCISLSGAIPLMMTFENLNDIAEILEKADGVLITGGGDVDPKYFNEELHEKADLVLPQRDAFEILLCKKAYELKKPILAICRGLQVLNVTFGGSLHQHIENHSFPDRRNEEIHCVNISENSLLSEIIGRENLYVNSIHHQAVNKLGRDLNICAISEDGIIEAIENKNHPFLLGVQWHPEAMESKATESETTESKHFNIFKTFVKSCGHQN